MTDFYIGRNIDKDTQGYYITFNDADLTSSDNKRCARSHFATYAKAERMMKHLRGTGSHWFDANYDPTI